ncbi:MAG: HEAT repeat domain-containing protein [Candidatus Dadabacteria bacterium]|nr:MAG: HEAT repeat domain-containing protein [Candidatus Dadabacteria bacterium]
MSMEQRRETLIGLLDDPHPAVQRVANAALERLDGFSGLSHLINELKSGETPRQVQAIYGLARVPGDQVLKILVQCLRHETPDVAAAAARVLQEQRDPRLVKPLVDILPHVPTMIQALLLETLGQLRDRRAVVPIIQLLPALDGEALERGIQALGRLGDPTAEQVLIGLTGHHSPRIRAAAALALGNLPPAD